MGEDGRTIAFDMFVEPDAGASLGNRWQGARPGLGESLADRGGDSAVADPSHVRRLACERPGLSGRGRPRVTCNGGGPMVIEAPVSTHVTRNGGAPQRRHLAKQVGLGSVRSGRRPGPISRLFPAKRGAKPNPQ